ncbi:MAG: hypothetical protein MK135_03340 [Polyangiaceae bacterium]|nr:hypothetical protein [Polyangiaceae bacterium]
MPEVAERDSEDGAIPSSGARSSAEAGAEFKECSPPRASWLAAVTLFAPLSLFAEVLIRKTHHRPLGAMTFALVAVLSWVGAELLSRRGASVVSPARARFRSLLWLIGGATSLLVLFRALNSPDLNDEVEAIESEVSEVENSLTSP